MSKLLVNAPNGAQELITVGEGGGYFDPARVLWDERVDGPLPAITLGGMVRDGDSLVFDQATFDATNAVSSATAKVAKWEAIKAHRDRLTQVGGYKVAVDGVDKWFHSDTFSRTQQIGLVMMGAGVPVGLQWKTMDGSFVTMTQAIASAVFSAAAAQDQALFAVAEQHRAAMEASADPGAYDFSGGWPSTFAQ